jgi:hypothetical protein
VPFSFASPFFSFYINVHIDSCATG